MKHGLLEGSSPVSFIIESGLSELISSLIFNIKQEKLDIHDYFSIGVSVAIILINRVLISNKSDIGTIIRTQMKLVGGLLGGVTVFSLLVKSRKKLVKNNPINLKNHKTVQFLLMIVLNVTDAVEHLAAVVSKTTLKLPDYTTYFKSAVENKDIIAGPKLILTNVLIGILVGGFGAFLLAKKYMKMTLHDVITVLKQQLHKGNVVKLIKSFFNTILTKNPETNKISINMSSVASIIQMIQPAVGINPVDKYLFSLLLNGKVQTLKVKDLDNPTAVDNFYLTLEDIDKPFFDNVINGIKKVRSLEPENFNKLVKEIVFIKSSKENACVSKGLLNGLIPFSKNYLCFIYKGKYSSWKDLTVDEFTGIYLHELGHAVTRGTGYNNYYILFGILLSIIQANKHLNIYVQHLQSYAISYTSTVLGRINEMQADAYAIKHGYGKELKSGLKKFIGDRKFDERTKLLQSVDVHDRVDFRLASIKKFAKQYNKLKKISK